MEKGSILWLDFTPIYCKPLKASLLHMIKYWEQILQYHRITYVGKYLWDHQVQSMT